MILLTGATGTIGQATAAALQAMNQPFRIAVRHPETHRAGDAVPFDWDDPTSYLPAFSGVDRLFLLTPNSELQVGYVVRAVAAARRAGVDHIVRLSVLGADADPGIIFGRLHFAAEREIRASGIAWTFLRPTFFMQNFVNYYGVQRDRDSEVRLPNGSGRFACVDARDVGEVAAKALTATGLENRMFELTGPEALDTGQALKILGDAWGHRYTYIDVPEDEARKAMEAMQMPPAMVDAMLELHALIRNGYAGEVRNGVQEALGRPARALREWAESV